jgi:NADH-quinone oxidoreductase subunit C
MTFQEISDILKSTIGDHFTADEKQVLQPQLIVPKDQLKATCMQLHTNPLLYFDFLSSVTGVDNGAEQGTFEVLYHLYSIPFNHHIILKVILERENPSIDSVIDIWKGADWQEREIYDMFGIQFIGHPDLRRILLPEDWQGFPLRKDYEVQEYYHGIKVESEVNND